MTTSPDRAGLLRDEIASLPRFYLSEFHGRMEVISRDEVLRLLAAAGDSEGPLDVERLRQAGVNVGLKMAAEWWSELIAEYVNLARLSSKGYDKADHAAREGVPEGDLG